MIIGYIRTSHFDQNPDRQIKELENRCERLVIEQESTRKKERPKLQKLLSKLWEGDVIMVTELSRISRSTSELLQILQKLKDEKAYFVSLKEGIDTRNNNIMTDLMITVLSGVYQFQRDLQKELQFEGIERAKERKKYKGKPEKFNKDHPKIKLAFEMYKRGDSVRDILVTTDISRGTLYKNLKRYGITRELGNVSK